MTESAGERVVAEPEPQSGQPEPARITNPFASFRTRSHWLAAMIRRGRDANPETSHAPHWFNH